MKRSRIYEIIYRVLPAGDRIAEYVIGSDPTEALENFKEFANYAVEIFKIQYFGTVLIKE